MSVSEYDVGEQGFWIGLMKMVVYGDVWLRGFGGSIREVRALNTGRWFEDFDGILGFWWVRIGTRALVKMVG